MFKWLRARTKTFATFTAGSAARAGRASQKLLVCALWLSSVAGCSAASRYGDEVRYAESVRGYVLASETVQNEPAEDAQVVILRNPITKRKLRCREDVEKWLPTYRQAVSDDVGDEGVMVASMIIMAPATAVASLAMDVFVLSGGVALAPYHLGSSEEGGSVYDRALASFARDEWERSTNLFELALVKDDALGTTQLGNYYLGIAYANQGRTDDARDALVEFVERAAVQEVTAYKNAERWLTYLDEPVAKCRSQAPLKIVW